MIRKSVLDQIWLLDPAYEKVDDYDLRLRIWKISQFANIPEFLVKYRYHQTNTTKQSDNLKTMRKLTIQVVKKHSKSYPHSTIGRICIQYILLWMPTNIFKHIRSFIFQK
jgi:hypothetical protein